MSSISVRSPLKLPLICLVSVGWAFSFGLGAPLASLWLNDLAASGTVSGLNQETCYRIIGLNTGTYYLGIAVAAALVPWMMRRWGHGCPALGMLLSGLSVALFPWGGSYVGWFGLRALNGVAGAMSLIPIETLVNQSSPTEQRGRNFGFYAFSIALGWALGNLVGLQLYNTMPLTAFVLGGLASVLAGLVVTGWLRWPAVSPEEHRIKAPLEPARNFLSFGSAWSQGFLEGGMIAFLSVYLLCLGLSEQRMSWLTSGIMIGVILFQVPVAWLADRLGRIAVLLACYVVTAAGLALLPFCADSPWLALWLFLVGGCSGAFYPLGLALLGDRVQPSGLARASAWYLAINCIGSLTGPVISGVVMDHYGRRAMFVVGEAAVVLVLLLSAVCRWRAGILARRQVSQQASSAGMEGRQAA